VEERMNQKVYEEIKKIVQKYSNGLSKQMDLRKLEMESDNKDHYLIYAVLGVNEEEGQKIDLYQNMGRFLYKYAGSFLEEVAIFCFKYKHPNAKAKEKLKNTIGVKPKTFEIDLLFDNKAHEIKWRDATTDGDHITKEHTRVKVIQSYGYQPIRVMFYYPNRSQAIRIQETLKTLYSGVGGIYYSGDDAWEYLKSETGIDLKEILIKIAEEKHNGKN
jgi:type II restriction enzyme